MCQEALSELPRDDLPSFMVWNAGGGRWWAATADISKTQGSVLSFPNPSLDQVVLLRVYLKC
jgi:hypothetical protein